MLINKSSKEIVGFKLVSGEEVVAKIVEENSTDYIVSKPMTLIANQQGLGMMQSMMSMNTNSNVILKKSAVVFVTDIIPDMENHYIETTSGIALAR